jgi:hypothetical protein
MSDPGQERFRDALAAYEQAVLHELGAARTLDAVRLIESVEASLPGGGVLYATSGDLEAAVKIALARMGDPETFQPLAAEVARFRSLAVEYGLVGRGPRGRTEVEVEIAAPLEAAPADREEIVKVVSRLVANIIEEGLQSALLISPMAAVAPEIGGRGGALDQTAELAGSRWRSLAHRLEKPLDVFRIAFPLVALVLALNSLFSCSGPIGTRTRSAFVTGAGVNQIKKLVRDMHSGLGDPATIETLPELAQRSGFPTDVAARTFRLRRVRWGAVYLEHIETGKTVVVTHDYVGSFDARGTWRMVK